MRVWLLRSVNLVDLVLCEFACVVDLFIVNCFLCQHILSLNIRELVLLTVFDILEAGIVLVKQFTLYGHLHTTMALCSYFLLLFGLLLFLLLLLFNSLLLQLIKLIKPLLLQLLYFERALSFRVCHLHNRF